MIREPTTLVLGRGQVYFDPFAPGTLVGSGERYIGNTTTFRIQRNLSTVARNTTYRGQRVDVGDEVIAESHDVTFITDHIALENIGLWYGDPDVNAQSVLAHSTVSETNVVRRGRYYQLGRSVSVSGARNVAVVELRVGGVTLVPQAGNYEVDEEAGRVRILPNALNILTGDSVEFRFEWLSQGVRAVQSSANQVEGALRFVSKNPVGLQRNYYFPRVRISPQGQIDLKGDDFQQILFAATALRLGPAVEQMYVDELTRLLTPANEQAVLGAGIRLSAFPALENLLDVAVETTLGEHGY
jgi:hypothetical protein